MSFRGSSIPFKDKTAPSFNNFFEYAKIELRATMAGCKQREDKIALHINMSKTSEYSAIRLKETEGRIPELGYLNCSL